MIRSMTAYARCQSQSKNGEILWELRSLNSKFLETHLKLNDEWRSLEPQVRKLISAKIKRGKVECQFRFKRDNQQSSEIVLNDVLCQALIDAAAKVEIKATGLQPISVIDILRWPEVIIESEKNIAEDSKEVLVCLSKAIDDLINAREQEGEKIKGMLLTRCDQIIELVQQVRARIPDIRVSVEKKLKQKLSEIDVTVDPHRFEQELVYLLQRLDIEEEVDRLQAHIEEVKKVLERDDSIGRRLDFFMQELNREANTLGSKVTDMDLKGISVELKVLIEQMREQVQNIE